MRVVSFRSDELKFDYVSKQVKLTKVAILSNPCCGILFFFDSACSSCPFRKTKHDRIRPENKIKTRLTIEEIERAKVCCNPDGTNRFANAIHFGCRRRGERRKRRQKIYAWCGNTKYEVRRRTSVKRRVHQS